MISQNLNAPLNASISTPRNAVHFANKPNVTNFLHYSVAIRSKPMGVCIVPGATLPRGEISTHTDTGRLSRPREISWPAYFSLGEGLAWFTCTNHA
jgi:hypothetical protein